MGCLSATVTFNDVPPSVAALVAALCHHTGEVISYDEERGELVCSASKDAFSALPSDTEDIYWLLLTTKLSGGYLWHAALAALQTLGGTYPYTLPVWAYKPWVEARQEYEQRGALRLTYDEARRLGIVT
jgi:hypothetical protein